MVSAATLTLTINGKMRLIDALTVKVILTEL